MRRASESSPIIISLDFKANSIRVNLSQFESIKSSQNFIKCQSVKFWSLYKIYDLFIMKLFLQEIHMVSRALHRLCFLSRKPSQLYTQNIELQTIWWSTMAFFLWHGQNCGKKNEESVICTVVQMYTSLH